MVMIASMIATMTSAIMIKQCSCSSAILTLWLLLSQCRCCRLMLWSCRRRRWHYFELVMSWVFQLEILLLQQLRLVEIISVVKRRRLLIKHWRRLVVFLLINDNTIFGDVEGLVIPGSIGSVAHRLTIFHCLGVVLGGNATIIVITIVSTVLILVVSLSNRWLLLVITGRCLLLPVTSTGTSTLPPLYFYLWLLLLIHLIAVAWKDEILPATNDVVMLRGVVHYFFTWVVSGVFLWIVLIRIGS